MMFILVISLILLIILTLYSQWILKGRDVIQELDHPQKVTYYLLLIGSIFLGFIVIISFILLFNLTLHTIINDPEAVGYIIIFYSVPFLLISTISASIVHVLLLTLRPASYMNKQKNNSVMYIIVGCISIFAISLYSYFINIGVEMTLVNSSISMESISRLESSIFHPRKVIYAIFFTGSLLLLIGGILNFFENRKQQPTIDDEGTT